MRPSDVLVLLMVISVEGPAVYLIEAYATERRLEPPAIPGRATSLTALYAATMELSVGDGPGIARDARSSRASVTNPTA